MVECALPGGSAGEVVIEVSNDGLVFSDDKHVFMREGVVNLVRLEPSLAPVRGGTMLTVWGSSFRSMQAAQCLIGKMATRATVVSRSRLRCETPATEHGGIVRVTVRTGGAAEAMSTALELEYVLEASIDGVLPSHGDRRGGYTITVVGTGFGSRAVCRYGARVARGLVWTSTSMGCTVPSGAAGMAVVLGVSNDAITYTTARAPFEYEEAVEVSGLEPAMSASETGGEVVTVAGRHFVNSAELSCRFGDAEPVRARYRSSTSIGCVSPSVADSLQRNSSMLVEVSNDGVVYTGGGFRFRYEPGLKLVQVQPSMGPVHGGSMMTILGSGFMAERSYIRFCGR